MAALPTVLGAVVLRSELTTSAWAGRPFQVIANIPRPSNVKVLLEQRVFIIYLAESLTLISLVSATNVIRK
jgi:hypothetical protein